MDKAALQAKVDALRWFHTIDVGHGVVTKGVENSPERLVRIQMPADLAGRSVLDVGAWDGFIRSRPNGGARRAWSRSENCNLTRHAWAGANIAEVAVVRRGSATGSFVTALFVVLCAVGCGEKPAQPAAESSSKKDVSTGERDAALKSARVWMAPPVPIGSADFSVNTPGPKGFAANADVDCRFSLEPVSGTTPKFYCTLPDGDRIKVKYSERPLPNGEVPAEIAASRLLAALGFPVDRMNRVKSVRCQGCPPLPQQALQCLEKGQAALVCLQGATPDRVVTFDQVVIERTLEGDKIEASKDQGWSWYELDRISPHAGGSSRAEVDALRLVAVLLAHWDNKGANQRLFCPEGAQRSDGSCRAPVAAIKDLGATFGPKRVDLENWKQVPIWADPASCRVSMRTLPFDGATFGEAQISEEGRQFALKLLRQLTRPQLNTLFDASGVAAFRAVLRKVYPPQAWTDAFVAKVDQIASAGPCVDHDR